MPIIITKNWRGSRMKKLPGNWIASESYTVTGTTSKSAAIDAVISEYPGHPDNPDLRIQPPTADAIGVADAWKVSADYTFVGVTLTNDHPLDQPTTFRGSIETIQVPADRDINGNPIVNSAGDPFDPPPTRSMNVFVLTCTRAIPAFSIAMGLEFTDTTNSAAISLPGAGTVAVGQGLCRYYGPVSDWKYGDPYVIVQGIFAFQDGQYPWDFHPRDAGRNSWWNDGGTKKRGAIINESGESPGFDVSLTGAGKPFGTAFKVAKDRYGTPADAVNNPSTPSGLVIDASRTTDDVTILEWYTLRESNWNNLPF